MLRKLYLILLCFISLAGVAPCFAHAQTLDFQASKAAFIRDGDLWTRIQGKEKRITQSGHVHSPQWSSDGQWIAYLEDVKPPKMTNDLWVYNVTTTQKRRIFQDAKNPHWHPIKPLLAFQGGHELSGLLNVSNLQSFNNVALGVDDFIWYPDGRSFLLESSATLRPDGWTNSILYKKNFHSLSEMNRLSDAKRFFIIPKTVDLHGEENLAIGADSFSFSPSSKWLSFIVYPTASLSMDSNMLCLLSKDGKTFKVLDEVIRDIGQPKWAPSKDTLGFIAGGGRLVFGYSNKKLKVQETSRSLTLTPKKKADLNFTWVNHRTLVTSRVDEQDWTLSPNPVLVNIKLPGRKQTQITHPPKAEGDYNPHYLNKSHSLVWLRSPNIYLKHADVWTAHADGSKAKRWISNVSDIAVYETDNMNMN
ncbi:hypothetical protein GMB86_07645 [Terrilactibacillus sp. BCM23-1]|uniref:TolB domain-containing protein n=1 Tax=Terrilactibacillus tamarindi TaxID=2599694 RepID=A0A6N8CP38_9BACI|nr:hypothetical protein [Terrilactibacillus tamarindi]MTT31882.1 hypothetical protein [Terrilactibacillus tamarindi]